MRLRKRKYLRGLSGLVTDKCAREIKERRESKDIS